MPKKPTTTPKNKEPTKIKRVVMRTEMQVAMDNRKIVDYQVIYQMVKPYLLLGVSLHRACSQALLNYNTVHAIYKRNAEFAHAVDMAQDNVSFIARSKVALRVKDTDRHYDKDIKYWLDNIDKGIKKTTVSGTKVTTGDVTIEIVKYE